MNKILHIILIYLFSLTIISCAKNEEEEKDTEAPVISKVTAVTTPTNDTTPNYIFSSTEPGTLTYRGSCSSSTKSTTTDNNTITLIS